MVLRQRGPHLHPALRVRADEHAALGAERKREDRRLVSVDAPDQLLLCEIPDAHLVMMMMVRMMRMMRMMKMMMISTAHLVVVAGSR